MVAIFAAFFPPGTVISRPSLDDPDRVDGLQVKEGGVEGVSGVGKAAGPVIGRACQRFALKPCEFFQPRLSSDGKGVELTRVQLVGKEHLINESVN